MSSDMSKMVGPRFYLDRAPIFIIILAFLFNIIVPFDLAWAIKTDTMPSPIGKEPSVSPGQLTLLSPHDIDIPPVFGTVKERFQQDKEPKGLIVHIQDLHTHYQAHKNIAGIIEYLNRKDNINVILCEAKETDRGFAYLRPWTRQEAREKVAEDYLKEGILTGWETLDLTSDLDLVLQGIEDKDLYMKDMDSFLKAEPFREDALKFVEVVKNIVENLKLHIYSRPQKAFDDKMRFYRDEKIGIGEYTNYLTKLAERNNIDYKDFTNLGILLETLELEKRIDFKRAETEREEIIDRLSKRLLEDEMKALLNMSMKFKANRISQNEFYQYLLSLAKRLDISLKAFPNFELYTRYIATYHNLDASRLFEEINNLENSLAEAIFTQEDQKRLFQISKNLIILKGLVDFKLTPDEFDYYSKTKTGFDIKNWLEFLRLNSEYFKLSQYVPDDGSIIEDNIPILESFYKVAHERDEAFVRNIDKQFTERKINTAILMTGGFHTPGVMHRLKEAGYSYVVISPRIEEEMDYERYHKILKESYDRLRESKAIAAWSLCDMDNDVLKSIIDKGREIGILNAVRVPETLEEIQRLKLRGAVLTERDGVGYIRVEVLNSAQRGEFDLNKFLALIYNVRTKRERVSPEDIREFLGMVEEARAAIRGEEGLTARVPEGEGEPDVRGYDGLPNDAYTPEIRAAIIKGNLAATKLVEGRFEQVPFTLDTTLSPERKAGSEISAAEQKVKLTQEQLRILNDLINAMGIQDMLRGTTIIFIPRQMAHYGVGRDQIYLDVALLDNPAELRRRLAHEVIERTDVITGLSGKFREELETKSTNPEDRSGELRKEIIRLAKESHARIEAFAPFMHAMNDVEFAKAMAEYLNNAYNRSQGYPEGPLVRKEIGNDQTGLTRLREAIAMNMAGFIALIDAVGYLAERRKVAPLTIIAAIAEGKVVKKNEKGEWVLYDRKRETRETASVLARFANAAWKAGQPFRGINRIERFVYRPFDLLPEGEKAKDFVQITAAATMLNEELGYLAEESPERQLEALRKLMQDINFARKMAEHLNNAYNISAGWGEGPLVKPGQEDTTTAMTELWEAVGMNLAGGIAVEVGVGLISEMRREAGKERATPTEVLRATPTEVLEDIATGKIFRRDEGGEFVNKEEAYLLARLANDTWKAGQPFRTPRVKKGDFSKIEGINIEKLWADLIKNGYIATKEKRPEEAVVQEGFFKLQTAEELRVAPAFERNKEAIFNILKGSYRITRAVFQPFDLLDKSEWDKDFDQIRAAAGELHIALSEAGRPGRGADNLPNDMYTPGIRAAIVRSYFAACRLVEGRFEQAAFTLDTTLTPERLAGSEISVDEQKGRLTPAQLEILNEIVDTLGIRDLLRETTIIFIPGQRAHYGVGRDQIYLDIALFNNPAELQRKLVYEVTERREVIRGLSEALREKLKATAANPELRSPELQSEIDILASRAHEIITRVGLERALAYAQAGRTMEEGAVRAYVTARQALVEARAAAAQANVFVEGKTEVAGATLAFINQLRLYREFEAREFTESGEEARVREEIEKAISRLPAGITPMPNEIAIQKERESVEAYVVAQKKLKETITAAVQVMVPAGLQTEQEIAQRLIEPLGLGEHEALGSAERAEVNALRREIREALAEVPGGEIGGIPTAEMPGREIPLGPVREEILEAAESGKYATVVAVHEGVVLEIPVVFIEGEIHILGEAEALGPEQAAMARHGRITRMPLPMWRAEILEKVEEVIGKVEILDIIIGDIKASKVDIYRQQGELIAMHNKLAPDKVLICEMDVDAIIAELGNLDNKEVQEALKRELAFRAECTLGFRRFGQSRVYFRFTGTDSEKVDRVTNMFEELTVVKENKPWMNLYGKETPEDAIVISLSYIESQMYFNNPTLFLSERTLAEKELNWYNWNNAFMAAIRLGLLHIYLDRIPQEEQLGIIEVELRDPASNVSKLAGILVTLTGKDVTAQDLLNLCRIYPSEENRQEYVDKIYNKGLVIKKITAVDFQELKRLYDMLGEVELAI